MSDLIDLFDKATIKTNDGQRYNIGCVKGLWGVSAPTESEANQTAKDYFIQYYFDGEYDDLKAKQ